MKAKQAMDNGVRGREQGRGTQVRRREVVSSLLAGAVGGGIGASCGGTELEIVGTAQALTLDDGYLAFDTIAELLAHPVEPTAAPATAVVLGYHRFGDGGGGVFRWDDSSDTEDGGTVFPAEPQGQWKRIFSGPLNVRWFGARADGQTSAPTNDREAIQAAVDAAQSSFASYNPPGVDAHFSAPTIFFPTGVYRVEGSIAVNSYLRLVGENWSQLAALDSTGQPVYDDPLLVVGGANNVVEHLSFANARNHIQVYGGVGNGTAGGRLQISDCIFSAPGQSAIVLDKQSLMAFGRSGSPLSLQVRACQFFGSRFYTGTFDEARFEHCRVWFAPANSPIVNQEGLANYEDLACFNSGSNLSLSHCFLVGANREPATDTRAAYIRTSGRVNVNRCDSGDMGCTFIRCVKPGPSEDEEAFLTEIERPTIQLSDSSINNCAGRYWMEILSDFPAMIDVSNGVSTHQLDAFPSEGIYVDAAATPPTARTYVRLDIPNSGACTFHEGTDPSDIELPDVSSRYTEYMTRPGRGVDDFVLPGGATENLFFPDVYSDLQLSSTPNNIGHPGGTPTSETATGYDLRILTATADRASVVYRAQDWVPPGGEPGEYVFSLAIWVSFDTVVQMRTIDPNDGPNAQGAHKQVLRSGAFRRLWMRFHHDGATPVTLSYGIYKIPSGGEFSTGLYAVHPGPQPAAYLFPGNPAPEGSGVKQVSTLTGPPTAGTWRKGDIIYNSDPKPNDFVGWVFTDSGWQPFGAIST